MKKTNLFDSIKLLTLGAAVFLGTQATMAQATIVVEPEDYTLTGSDGNSSGVIIMAADPALENTIDDVGTAGDGIGVGRNSGAEGINFVNSGDWADIPFEVAEAGTYQVTYMISSPNADAEIKGFVSGVEYSVDAVNNNGEWDVYESLVASGEASLTAGSHVLRVQASSDADWQWNLEKVTFVKTGELSIKGFNLASNIKFASNPVSEIAEITGDAIDEIQVFNIAGQQLMTTTEKAFNVSTLVSGMYFAHIKAENNTEGVLRFSVK